MAAKTFSIEDVIADEVQKAVSANRPAPAVFGVAEQMHTGGTGAGGGDGGTGGGGIAGLDIKSITGLLKEINIMLQSRKESGAPGYESGAPVANVGAPPAGLPGVDCVPVQNPRPAGTDAPAGGLAGYEPEKVFDMIRGALEQVKAAVGDVTLSELDEFMAGNRPVVVALISQEMKKL